MSAPINCCCLSSSPPSPVLICAVRQQEVPLTNWLQPCPAPSQAESRHYYDRISNALPNSPQLCATAPLPAPSPSLYSVTPPCLFAWAVIVALALIDASFCCVYLLFARRTHKSHAVRSFFGVLRACDLHLVLLVARFVCMRFPGPGIFQMIPPNCRDLLCSLGALTNRGIFPAAKCRYSRCCSCCSLNLLYSPYCSSV